MPTIIFKATEACNCRCCYCDVVTRRRPLTISDETLSKVFMRLEEYLSANQDDNLNVIFHGGEPLVSGMQFFEKIEALVTGMDAGCRRRLGLTMQSNLTLLTPGLVALFKRLGITGIGTSYDWIEGVRGIGDDRDTALYNKRFMRGLNLLDEAGMIHGIIYVVTARAVSRPVDTYNNLLNLSPDGFFSFNPVLVYDGAPEEARATAITGRQYADFLGAILPLWLERKDVVREIEPFTSIYRYCAEGIWSMGCNEASDCGPMLYIGPDGSISQCGRSADWGLLDYGNIADVTICQALNHPDRQMLAQRTPMLRQGECSGCAYWEICHGGCPLDAHEASGRQTFNTRSGQCLWLNIFMKEYFEPLTGLTVPQNTDLPS